MINAKLSPTLSRPRVIRTPPGGNTMIEKPAMYDYGDYGYNQQNVGKKPYLWWMGETQLDKNENSKI